MALQDIRKNYGKFLTALSKAGVQLTESQKSDVDTFMLALESSVNKKVETATKVAKKLVEEELEKKYKSAITKLMENIEINQKLTKKIQERQITESVKNDIADKVDGYLNLYVESSLPKKTIVNYDKLRKLETLVESLKDTLLVNDESVEAKKEQLAESFNEEKKALETKLAKLQVKLNESMEKSQTLAKKVQKLKSVELLESKTKDLPMYEAQKIKKRLSNATPTEIEMNFKKVLESIQEETEQEQIEEEMTLESEIKGILDSEDIKENDLLRNRHHNAHISETEDVKSDDEETEPKEVVETDDEEQTSECGDDVYAKEMCESVNHVNDDLMKLWLSKLQ